MTPDEEMPNRKTDVFDIGIYVIEVAVIAAVIYAMIAFPMWLKL